MFSLFYTTYIDAKTGGWADKGRIAIKTTEPKLNDKQLLTLKLTYKFRYLTTDTLARRRDITHNSAYSALTILTQRGYLGRKHTKAYKLQNKSARYHLTLKAVKLLSQHEYGLNKKVLLTRRYEDKKSQAFIDLQVSIMEAYLDIKEVLEEPEKLIILTATEMAKLEDAGFIRPLPSLYIHYPKTGFQCFMDIIPDDQHLFLAKKRIRKYLEHCESGEWETNKYPNVYLVRRSASDRKRLKAYINEKMDDNYLDEDDINIQVINTPVELLD